MDDNQGEIVLALRACGVSVEIVGKPLDLLCWNKRTFFIEVKNADGKDTITKEQAEFLARWPGETHVVRTIEQALVAALGDKAMR